MRTRSKNTDLGETFVVVLEQTSAGLKAIRKALRYWISALADWPLANEYLSVSADDAPEGIDDIPPTCGVYRITHVPTGSFYIGASRWMQHRWHGHLGQLRKGKHSVRRLQTLFDCDGTRSLRIEVIEHVRNEEQLDATEIRHIKSSASPLLLNTRHNPLKEAA